MARRLEDFITGYLEYAKGTESPKQYHLWSALSCIAAALQRKVYMIWGTETLYPNMYIILIGPSGKCRKGVAIGIAQDLVRSVGIKITAESITREALIKDMKESVQTIDDPVKGIVMHCSLTTHSPELSVFLKQKDVAFLADLTDWYDSKSEWTYRTKNSGTDTINGICFNLLGASAPDWLTSILPEEAIGGGFTSRIIFVVEEEKGQIVPLPVAPDENIRQLVRNDLEEIFVMKGEMRLDAEATAAYEKWYKNHHTNPVITDMKFAGYNERKATHIKKLSMLLSASRSDSMIVTVKDFERALTILEIAEKRMPRVFRTLGKSKYATVTLMIYDFIKTKKVTTRSAMLSQFYMDVDEYTLEIITKTLAAMKAITITHSIEEREIQYRLIEKEE